MGELTFATEEYLKDYLRRLPNGSPRELQASVEDLQLQITKAEASVIVSRFIIKGVDEGWLEIIPTRPSRFKLKENKK